MCGIAAAIGLGRMEGKLRVGRLLQRIAHRGLAYCRDETGAADGWALGVNRLPLQSLPSQLQPRWSEDKSVMLAYNGEVYNWRSIWHAVCGSLASPADETQTLVEWLAIKGPSALEDFDGMFAFAWIDLRRQRVFWARDPLGVKPLYWAWADRALLLASEVKALSPESEVNEIFEMEPGSWASASLEDPKGCPQARGTYSDILGSLSRDAVEDGSSLESELARALDESVGRTLETRHRVGVLLSGGVDSSSILALGLRHREDLVAVTGGKSDSDDVKAASKLARTLGADLVVGVIPEEEALFATVENVVGIVESFEPNVVRQGSASLFLAKLARDNGLEVLLCGEGADELFCGYPEFCLRRGGGAIQDLRWRFLCDLARTQLQRVDRTSMALTLEVRVPYLSKRIISLALQFRVERDLVANRGCMCETKIALRNSLRYILGDEWRLRPKVVLSEGMGFKGNDPEDGMFAQLAKQAISGEEVLRIQSEFGNWGIETPEEALYFREFHRLGYAKLSSAKKRVFANRIGSRL